MTTFLEETHKLFREKFPEWEESPEWRTHLEEFIYSRLTLQRKEMREIVLELVQKYHDTKYHNDAEKALSDVLNAFMD